MRTSVSICLSSLVLCLQPAAQPPTTGPAKELKKLECFVGTWEGSGTATMAPGAPEGPWTSKSSYRWVLGGHFLREDTRVDLPGGMGHLGFINYMGWDRENKKYMSFMVGNDGMVQTSAPHWTSDSTIVQVNQTIEGGQLMTDRWITHIENGEYDFEGHRAIDDGEPFVFLAGAAKRISKEASSIDLGDEVAMMTDTSKMRRFAGICGMYAVKGWMIPAPGQPKMDISGTDKAELILGGSILKWHTVGDPHPEVQGPDYEGVGYLGWDANAKRYRQFSLSNMGEAHVADCWWMDEGLVMTGSSMQAGQPMLGRTLLQLDDGGVLARVTSDMISGATAPARVFEASYKKRLARLGSDPECVRCQLRISSRGLEVRSAWSPPPLFLPSFWRLAVASCFACRARSRSSVEAVVPARMRSAPAIARS